MQLDVFSDLFKPFLSQRQAKEIPLTKKIAIPSPGDLSCSNRLIAIGY